MQRSLTRIRETKPGKSPWCFQHEVDLQFIVDQIEGTNAAHCIATYVALTRTANQERSTKFIVKQSRIAEMASLCVKTVAKCLKMLKEIGLLDIQERYMKDTHARLSDCITLRTTCPTLRTTCRTSRTEMGPQDSELSQEDKKNQYTKERKDNARRHGSKNSRRKGEFDQEIPVPPLIGLQAAD